MIYVTGRRGRGSLWLANRKMRLFISANDPVGVKILDSPSLDLD